MSNIKLPPSLSSKETGKLGTSRQISIIGGAGAGKSRFMDEMMLLNGPRSYSLNAVSAFYPQKEQSMLPGSIDDLYRQAVKQKTYMRTDAVSELDKILYMLFADELESLLTMKDELKKEGRKYRFQPSKLDIIQKNWERIFPGNKIRREPGMLKFSTTSGADLISTHALSQGEKTVLYYLGAVLYAMPEAVIFIDSPSLFLHPSILGSLWNSIEELRPDCTFVYNSVDEEFVSTRTNNACIWVKSFDSKRLSWDYRILSNEQLAKNLTVEIGGSRRPVLFIEGDNRHSIDIRLYSLVFKDMTVKPVGSCDKVIETTRALNDQSSMHHLKSQGIVDRDRRTPKEVEYLRSKRIMVPEVAEIENIFLLPGVILTMAKIRGLNGENILGKVSKEVIRMFKCHFEEQVMQHVRHRIKREVECKIDGKFTCITALETHLKSLANQLQPRKRYNELRTKFSEMIRNNDYTGILRVFNHKPMLPDSGVHRLLGFKSKDDYIGGVLGRLKSEGKYSEELRNTIKSCLQGHCN